MPWLSKIVKKQPCTVVLGDITYIAMWSTYSYGELNTL